MANKKKSIDQAREESRKNKKNSTNKRKKYYARTITDLDFVEVKKQFPYIEKDAKGIYYINTQGEREEIHFPELLEMKYRPLTNLPSVISPALLL